MRSLALLASSLLLMAATPAPARTLHVPMTLVTPSGPGAPVGEIIVRDARGVVAFRLRLHGLPPGPHGFHVHANGSCEPATAADGKVTPAGGAGGHLDPDRTGMHMGPAGMGHLGDLPLVTVDANGTSRQTLLAPRIRSTAQLRGRALMLHAGGDNYSDQPAPLGGGGPRMACGVIAR